MAAHSGRGRSPARVAAAGLVLASAAAAQDAEALFFDNCASCHGETGDGDGWTELDRPARSFRDGGFSYGNTPEALFRAISIGIPGTQMPGFDTSLAEEERRALYHRRSRRSPVGRDLSEWGVHGPARGE